VRIAVNESLMKLRKRKSDRTVSLDESIDTGEEMVVREIAVWEGTRNSATPGRAPGHFGEGDRQFASGVPDGFCAAGCRELSTEETAAMLDLSIPAVKSRLLRARLQLRERLTRFFRRKGDDVFAYM